MFKIKYQLNILPSVSEEDGQLMGAIQDSDELEIFETELVKDLIDYKWQRFAQKQHMFAACIHITYVICLIVYINKIFLKA